MTFTVLKRAFLLKIKNRGGGMGACARGSNGPAILQRMVIEKCNKRHSDVLESFFLASRYVYDMLKIFAIFNLNILISFMLIKQNSV